MKNAKMHDAPVTVTLAGEEAGAAIIALDRAAEKEMLRAAKNRNYGQDFLARLAEEAGLFLARASAKIKAERYGDVILP